MLSFNQLIDGNYCTCIQHGIWYLRNTVVNKIQAFLLIHQIVKLHFYTHSNLSLIYMPVKYTDMMDSFWEITKGITCDVALICSEADINDICVLIM